MKSPNSDLVEFTTFSLIVSGAGGILIVFLSAIVGGVVWVTNNYGVVALMVFASALSVFLLVTGIALRVGYVKYVEEDRGY